VLRRGLRLPRVHPKRREGAVEDDGFVRVRHGPTQSPHDIQHRVDDGDAPELEPGEKQPINTFIIPFNTYKQPINTATHPNSSQATANFLGEGYTDDDLRFFFEVFYMDGEGQKVAKVVGNTNAASLEASLDIQYIMR
jgi:hypothetical protein